MKDQFQKYMNRKEEIDTVDYHTVGNMIKHSRFALSRELEMLFRHMEFPLFIMTDARSIRIGGDEYIIGHESLTLGDCEIVLNEIMGNSTFVNGFNDRSIRGFVRKWFDDVNPNTIQSFQLKYDDNSLTAKMIKSAFFFKVLGTATISSSPYFRNYLSYLDNNCGKYLISRSVST